MRATSVCLFVAAVLVASCGAEIDPARTVGGPQGSTTTDPSASGSSDPSPASEDSPATDPADDPSIPPGACTFEAKNVCDNKKKCVEGACKACWNGRFNCNRTAGCECDSAGCDGEACAGACVGKECPATCEFKDVGACGKKKRCSEGQCKACVDGRFNCNRTKGCECDSAGCDGEQCAGQCVGNECN